MLTKAVELLGKLTLLPVKILHGVGVSVLAALMVLTAADVTLRYLFNRPIIGSYDLTEYMMAIVVAFGIAYCAFLDGHVKVDIIVNRFPTRVQAYFDSITSLLSLVLFIFITWQSFEYTILLFNSGLRSTVLLIPRFPFAGVVFLGSAFLSLVLLLNFLEYLSRAVRK